MPCTENELGRGRCADTSPVLSFLYSGGFRVQVGICPFGSTVGWEGKNQRRQNQFLNVGTLYPLACCSSLFSQTFCVHWFSPPVHSAPRFRLRRFHLSAEMLPPSCSSLWLVLPGSTAVGRPSPFPCIWHWLFLHSTVPFLALSTLLTLLQKFVTDCLPYLDPSGSLGFCPQLAALTSLSTSTHQGCTCVTLLV